MVLFYHIIKDISTDFKKKFLQKSYNEVKNLVHCKFFVNLAKKLAL